MTSVSRRFSYIQNCIHKSRTLFHRDETKPTHIKNIITFLLLMQLEYKHSSPNDQRWSAMKNWSTVSLVIVSVSWDIFNHIHFFALCDDDYNELFVSMQYYKRTYWDASKQLRHTIFCSYAKRLHY